MGKLSRTKGKSFERETAKTFRALFPTAKRTLTQQRDSGEAPDIEIPGWWVECKAHIKVPIRKAFEQAVDEVLRAKSKLKPVAVTKDNGKEVLVTLRQADFLELLSAAEGQKTSVSLRAHLDTATRYLDKRLGPASDIEVTLTDRIRQLEAGPNVPVAIEGWQTVGKP